MAVAQGATTDAFCPSCGAITRQTIAATKGSRAAKAECTVCKSVHPYRKNAPEAKAKKKSPFEDATGGRDMSKAIPYKTNRKFNADDLIKHKTFGIGLVTRVVTDKKMEVLFEQSTKLLIHGQ